MLGPLARLAGSDGPRPAAVSCAALPSLILFFFFFSTIAVAAAWTGTKSRPAPAGSVAACLAVTPAAASARPGALPAAPFPAKEELPLCKAGLILEASLRRGAGRISRQGQEECYFQGPFAMLEGHLSLAQGRGAPRSWLLASASCASGAPSAWPSFAEQLPGHPQLLQVHQQPPS